MKIYIFNHDKDWFTAGACLVVAPDEETAVALYERYWYTPENQGWLEHWPYQVTEHAIEEGLMVVGHGYDDVSLSLGVMHYGAEDSE